MKKRLIIAASPSLGRGAAMVRRTPWAAAADFFGAVD
jgi:hypothetical protein